MRQPRLLLPSILRIPTLLSLHGARLLGELAKIIRFALRAAFIAAVVAGVVGCGGSPSSNTQSNQQNQSGTTASLASGGAASVYVIQTATAGTSNSILQFSATASGAVSPTATLLPPAAMTVDSVATDSSGQIYVGGIFVASSTYEILVYAPGATGSATPLRTIVEGGTYIPQPSAIAVGVSGLVYVLDGLGEAVAVYSSTANGVTAPTTLIQGSALQLSGPQCLAVDAAGNIYVSGFSFNSTTSPGSILVYSSSATGNATPARTITSEIGFVGIAVDTSGNIYAAQDSVTESNAGYGPISTSASILEYSAGASGAATPVKTITSSALTYGGGLRLDAAGNLYVLDLTISGTLFTSTAVPYLLGFGPTATGNTTPAVNFTSAAWTDPGPQIALH